MEITHQLRQVVSCASLVVTAACGGGSLAEEELLGDTGSISQAAVAPNEVHIYGNTPDWAAVFVDAVGQAGKTVIIAGNVNLDLSGYENIRIAPGVKIVGDRSVYAAGPSLLTTTFPRTLLLIGDDGAQTTSDDVRISGIRIQGAESDDPFSAVDLSESDGIAIESSRHVEIDHCELHHWRGSGVVVRDRQNRLALVWSSRWVLPPASSVWVHDNFIHHNQHPTHDGWLPGGGHGAGYGVQIADGAYALIEANVFDYNRHAIAGDGSATSGYLAYRNLILPHGGINSRQAFGIILYTHAIDMHGTDTCGFLEGDHNCGPAGEYMDVEYNTVLYTNGSSIHLRGTPERMMEVGNNIFANSEHDDAIVQNESGLSEGANTFGLDTSNEPWQCDFDGDGINDRFLATGATWWYSSSRSGGSWQYLYQSSARGVQVALVDVTGDGRCDVIGDGVVLSPTTYGRAAPTWSGWDQFDGALHSVAVAKNADGRLELFGTNSGDSIFHRWQLTPGGAWSGWAQLDGLLHSVAAETNADGRIELFGINSQGTVFHRSQVAPNGAWSAWAQFDGALSSVAVARNADGRLELFGTNSGDSVFHRWQLTPGGAWSGWVQLDGLLHSVAAETNADGRIELFGVNSQGSIFHRSQVAPNGAWSAWAQLDGVLTSIAVARNLDGRLEIFGANSGGSVVHRWQATPGGAWSAWAQLDGLLQSVAAESTADGRVELFGTNSGGNVFHRWQLTPGSP